MAEMSPLRRRMNTRSTISLAVSATEVRPTSSRVLGLSGRWSGDHQIRVVSHCACRFWNERLYLYSDSRPRGTGCAPMAKNSHSCGAPLGRREVDKQTPL